VNDWHKRQLYLHSSRRNHWHDWYGGQPVPLLPRMILRSIYGNGTSMDAESPEDLMRQMVALMAIMLIAAMYSVYVLYHVERESKRMLANYKAWSPHLPIVDEPAELARIRQRIIIFCAVVIAVCVVVDLTLFITILELKNRSLVAGQEERVAQAEEEKHLIAVEMVPRPTGSGTMPPNEPPMVAIPGGTFWMGIGQDETDRAVEDCKREMKERVESCPHWIHSAQPRHQVTLDPFALDPYEVTNQQFDRFVQAMDYQTTAEKEGTALIWTDGHGWQETKGATWRQPEAGPDVFASDRAEHPVINVSWYDAAAYCRWAGKRLPTEAEFEYANRAGTQTVYWWGNFSPTRQVANVRDESAQPHFLSIGMPGYDDGVVITAPVGSYEANPFGLFDMTGNVGEWTADWYDGFYYHKSPERNPTGPSSGKYRITRGGAWSDAWIGIQPTDRSGNVPTKRDMKTGFRCAQDRPK